MRTLVVSDLHLGARAEHDVLRKPSLRAPLLAALHGVERLVLLGDTLELRQRPIRDALGAAREVLEDIGASLGAGAEVVIVPGNHDHHLAEPWLERRARNGPPAPLGFEAAVDWRGEEALAMIADRLAPVGVRAAYPGVWLRNDVYAMHGHYGDLHTTIPTFERLGAGVTARIVGGPAGGPRRAEDYEAALAPVYAWLHAVAQSGGTGESSQGASARAWRTLAAAGRRPNLRHRALLAGFPALIGALNRSGMGPLRANVSAPELRRAALAAAGEVLARLGVQAPHFIFGHTHRAGPLPRDEPAEFSAPTGSRMLNTGSWVREPQFVGDQPRTSPYRAGFAAIVEDDGPPELHCLLDGPIPRARG